MRNMLRGTLVAALTLVTLGLLTLPVSAQVGDNTALSLAWHEASDFEFARGYVFSAGAGVDQIDIDQDGKGEILTYDGDGGKKPVYLFEVTGDNSFALVWSYQFTEAGIVGGERGIMVTDLDNDGFEEVTVIIDSYHPDSTALNGFNAGNIFEWDGTDNGLPTTPTATFDPPRDALGQVRLEYNTQALDLDGDGKTETDGIDVTNFNLGPQFPNGLFIAQDDENPGGNQNFKFVAWEEIANSSDPPLSGISTWDPRQVGLNR